MSFYSSDSELALMAPVDDSMGHLFPASTCQSPPSILYSPSLQEMPHQPPVTLPSNDSIFAYPHDYRQVIDSPYPQHAPWSSHSSPMALPQVSAYSYPPFTAMTTAPTMASDTSLLPQSYESRPSRSHSASSSIGLDLSSIVPSERSPRSLSRSLSPSSPDLRAYGFPNKNGTWSCAHPGCTSRAVFTRGCDLRKHHKRHTKSFFCGHLDCPQSTGGGFSSKKDLARHEAKHNPGVLCDWDGCDRVFSRVDNMRDHVKRIHLKTSRKSMTS
ncbi:hypothetical protein BDU57DRAFT_439532 [Ampelomyces quisqualis]|uniref:C2H2-type domain-containing protein n=1 Tax=Ampelomyces quisqualis TaxID=50730 RepID=A0A6A5R2H3_AMPQU|nr:hypothetical protein BDU57DRAFT_439532 [Ampelomyces quisqualis]